MSMTCKPFFYTIFSVRKFCREFPALIIAPTCPYKKIPRFVIASPSPLHLEANPCYTRRHGKFPRDAQLSNVA